MKSVFAHRSEDLLSLWDGNTIGDYGSFSVCYLTIIRQLLIVPWWTSLSSLKKKDDLKNERKYMSQILMHLAKDQKKQPRKHSSQ